MEITKEIKVKVFAQYIGQKIMLHDHNIFTGFHCEGAIIKHLENGAIGQPKLILQPLSSITDEDATEVAKMIGIENDNIEKAIEQKDDLIEILCSKERGDSTTAITPIEVFLVYQFLQSKGYDMPNYLLGGKTLQECGLAIYK